ncbi:ABC-type phosphonate transport system, ATPase component [Raoultella terrigena]|uniref:ABC-type phosphonate transport system, ATPase component n=1 Tax=Raoultella terrigena TaxID=577 RepID=A0A4V6J2E1_RAOTE|nr:ABC-type phosphonate transport system, ATPase component [Raoultella terrigena]
MNAIRVENVHKTFVLHQQNGVRLPVLADASLTVNVGECVVLHGHSGSGKSPCCARCTPTTCRTPGIFTSATARSGLTW